MITMQKFLLHCASQSPMNTVHYLTRIRFALVLRKIHITLDDKVHFCGICIVVSTLKFVPTETQAETFFNGQPSKVSKTSEKFCFCSFETLFSGMEQTNTRWHEYFGLLKLSLYKFQYEEMFPRYGADRVKVAYKDTDSLLYRIKTEELYKNMATFKHLLDLSEHSVNHFLQEKANKKVPLTMTDELNGKVLKQVVCLSSNLYSIDHVGGTKQSAKGVQKSFKKGYIIIYSQMVEFLDQQNVER